MKHIVKIRKLTSKIYAALDKIEEIMSKLPSTDSNLLIEDKPKVEAVLKTKRKYVKTKVKPKSKSKVKNSYKI